jgi:transcriptional regulator with XRE-family HTH domain
VATKSPNSIDVYVGRRVRTRRLELGMSLEKLGSSIGVTFQQLQKYEKGSNRISASRLQQLCDILKVSVGYFFEEARYRKSNVAATDYVSEFLATTDGHQLARAFVQIKNVQLRHRIAKLANEIAGERVAALRK